MCAFLRAKCGAEVTLDLLDSVCVSVVGKVQWLEMQQERARRSPSDKILILCSRGVAAKWRAMCGGRAVTLREDQTSSVGDMLTPALALMVPDFTHSISPERYVVAYFEEVSSENDVPSLFHTTVKYKLMKHFEELLFRIQGLEQHEPGRVNRIYGVAVDDYFLCPPGKALRDAIEAFQAYQLDNPDWFSQELVGQTEEEKDIGSDLEPLEDSVYNHTQDDQDCKGSLLFTNIQLDQAVLCANANTDNMFVYPSANELVLAVSPEITQSQVNLQSNNCSVYNNNLMTSHAFGLRILKESEESYWSEGYSKHDYEEHPRQELNVTPVHTGLSSFDIQVSSGCFCLEDECHHCVSDEGASQLYADDSRPRLLSGMDQGYISRPVM